MEFFLIVFGMIFIAFIIVAIYLSGKFSYDKAKKNHAVRVLRRALPFWIVTIVMMIILSIFLGTYVSLESIKFIITGGLSVFLFGGLIISFIETNKLKKENEKSF